MDGQETTDDLGLGIDPTTGNFIADPTQISTSETEIVPGGFFDNLTPELFQEMVDIFRKSKNSGPSHDTYDGILQDIENNTLSSDYIESVTNISDMHLESKGIDQDKAVEIIYAVLESFSGELLKKGLVNGIELRFDLVNVQLPDDNPLGIESGEYCVSADSFEQYWNIFTDKQKDWFSRHVFRGESYATWFKDNLSAGKYFSSPIVLYNQSFDLMNIGLKSNKDPKEIGLEYLESIEPSSRQDLYHIGSLNHEVAHDLYAYLIHGTELDEKWREVVDQSGNVTNYAQYWEEKNSTRDYDENFAEAIRIYTTIPRYMDSERFTPIQKFIAENFPDIKAA